MTKSTSYKNKRFTDLLDINRGFFLGEYFVSIYGNKSVNAPSENETIKSEVGISGDQFVHKFEIISEFHFYASRYF